MTNGSITFGSLNNFVKINPEVITVWIRLLKSIPDSRLHLLYNGPDLEELSGDNEEAYISAAQQLAADKDKLASLRVNLRTIMSSSCVMAAGEFTRNLETAYQTMWRDWCKTQGR